jgi:alginate O-acetyltransferase complex protein AlgI
VIFDSLTFWAALLALGAFAILFGERREGLLAGAVIAVSVLILHRVIGMSAWSLAAIAATGLMTAWSAQRKWNPWLVFTPVLLLWMAGKLGTAWPSSALGWLSFLGFSFMLVKVWTLLKDARTGQATDVRSLTVLSYLFYFPTYIAGPMHYYTEFRSAVRDPRLPNPAELVDLVFRILLGMIKVKFIVPLLKPASLAGLTNAGELHAAGLCGASFAYYAVIYCDFSGYSDMAIAATRLAGLTAPENFRQPYFAANIREFWQRWHITFSRVLTNYIFVPISRALVARWSMRRETVMISSYLVTFLFCGFWHGSTFNFLLWGMYHAGGLILYDLYKPWATKRRLKAKRPAIPAWRATLSHAAAVSGTLLFVTAGWIFFALPTKQLWSLAGKLLRL